MSHGFGLVSLHFDLKIDFESSPLFPGLITFSKLPSLDYNLLFFILLLEMCDFSGKMSLKQLAYAFNYDNPSPHFYHSTIMFLLLGISSHFVPILKTLSWVPNCSIVGCSCILKMVGHYYPQNIWHFGFAEKYHFRFYFLEALFRKNLLAETFCK